MKPIKSQNAVLTFFLLEESDELVVFSELDASVHVLSAYSVFIWMGLEEGLSLNALRRLLVESDADDFNDELLRLSRLFNTGLLGEKEPTDYDQTITGLVPLEHFYKERNWHVILNSAFAFEGLDAVITQVLASFVVVKGGNVPSKQHYCIAIQEDRGSYSLSINGQTYRRNLSYSLLVPFVLGLLRQLVKQDSDYRYAIHGAAFSYRGIGLMFPAVSGAGKTTLSATLLKQADFKYLSDELILLNDAMCMQSLPIGLGIKQGSYAVLAELYPELENTEELLRSTGIKLKYLPVQAENCAVGGDFSANVLIVPAFTQGGEASVETLSIGESIHEIFKAGFHVKGDLSLAYLQQLIAQLAAMQRYKLQYSSSEEAINLIYGLVNSTQ